MGTHADNFGCVLPLLPHQRRACALLSGALSQGHSGLTIAHAPGLGKTLTVLHFIKQQHSEGRFNRVLVVVPNYAIARQWLAQAKDAWPWTPLFVNLYMGPKGTRRASEHLVNVVSRPTLTSDIRERGVDIGVAEWDCIAWDEGHEYANLETVFGNLVAPRPKYAVLLDLRRKFNVVLTGTPYKNNETDIKSLCALMGLGTPQGNDWSAFWSLHSDRQTLATVGAQFFPVVTESVRWLPYPSIESKATAKAALQKVLACRIEVTKALQKSRRHQDSTRKCINSLHAATAAARLHSTCLYTSMRDAIAARTDDHFDFYSKALKNPKVELSMEYVMDNPRKKIVIVSDFVFILQVRTCFCPRFSI